MSTIPQGESLKSSTDSAAHSPAESPSPTVLLYCKAVEMTARPAPPKDSPSVSPAGERPVVILIEDNPAFALDIVRALRVSPDVRACLLTDLSNGLQRVDVFPFGNPQGLWKRGAL